MLSMTPRGEAQRMGESELEASFLDAIEPMPLPKPWPQAEASHEGGWLSNLADRLLMKFVCCGPPKALLEDFEIAELLAADAMAAAHVTKPKTKSSAKERQARRSSTIAPLVSAEASTSVEQEAVEFSSTEPVGALIEMKDMKKTTGKRAAVVIQRAWQKYYQYRVEKKARLTKTTASEPVVEAKTPAKRRSATRHSRKYARRHTSINSSSSSSPNANANLSPDASARPMWSPVGSAAPRKRSRSAGEQKPQILFASVERDVRWSYFHDEEIDDDEELVQATATAFPGVVCTWPRNGAVSRCDFRPICMELPHLPTTREEDAARCLQCAWRCMKARQELTSLRRMKEYEDEKQSVMPTIRNKMAEMRKRLEAMKEERSSSDETSGPEDDDDDFNFL